MKLSKIILSLLLIMLAIVVMIEITIKSQLDNIEYSISKGSDAEVREAVYMFTQNKDMFTITKSFNRVEKNIVDKLEDMRGDAISDSINDYNYIAWLDSNLFNVTRDSSYLIRAKQLIHKDSIACIQKQKEDSIACIQKQKEDSIARIKQIARTTGSSYSKVSSLINNHPNWHPDVINAVLNKSVHIGMTKEQAVAGWGRPNDINTTTGSWGVHEQWCYGDIGGSYLYFEDGVLTSIQN